MPLRSLSNELQEKAERELNEVPERTQDDFKHILEWLVKQPHLNIRKDENWLLCFLRGCKFSLQRAKEKLDFFYTMRTLLPEYFTNRDPFLPEMQEFLKAGVMVPLPKTKDQTGPRIILFRFDGCDPDRMPLTTLMRGYYMMIDVLMNEDDNCMISGVILWADYSKFPLSYMLQYTPKFIKSTVLCLQSAYPVRIKGIYCTTTPSVFEAVFNLFKALMNDKLKKRMFLYSEATISKIYEHIPQNLMPNEYGGNAGSIKEITGAWKKKMESYKDWFLEDAKYGSNEKLRLGKPKTSADLFGMEGTFRQLAID